MLITDVYGPIPPYYRIIHMQNVGEWDRLRVVCGHQWELFLWIMYMNYMGLRIAPNHAPVPFCARYMYYQQALLFVDFWIPNKIGSMY